MHKDIIIWEKWKDPFGMDDEIIIPYQKKENDEDFLDTENEEETEQTINTTKYQVIATPFGIIPITENTASGKIFNFWTGHTNFPITEKISFIIEETEGVETLNVFTKYRFRISVGKAFKDSKVMRKINNNVYAFLNKD